MTTVQYVCASSSRTIHGKLDEDTAWFEFHQVAHLFGTRPDKAAKVLRQVDATGEINAAQDVVRTDKSQCYLNHKAVLALGYHMNYGRATAFRKWCASALPARCH
jgi:hypothetical protein